MRFVLPFSFKTSYAARYVVGVIALAFVITTTPQASVLHADEAIIIAHRGASGYRPEHTIASYTLGIEQGADYIEPDLVMTKDGVFVARHDVYLSTTTDVANRPEFADRKRIIDGHDDWFIFDFTLAELKTLKAVQAFKGRSKDYDGLFDIPTLDEIVSLVQSSDRQVGLHIEMKRPQVFKGEIDAKLALKLAARLDALIDAGIPVFFQCFDGNFLRELAPLTKAPLVYLVSGKPNASNDAYILDGPLDPYFSFVDGFGLYKALLFDAEMRPNGLTEKIHAAGKLIHVWTVRDDSLPKGVHNVSQEIKTLLTLPVDGIFTDFPDTAVAVRNSVNLLSKEID
ncbi:glycerophosphodiester phosphodiesterase family protein [Kordiimonas aquimaris]|uniref:glycerophosphodiester phosphodiesterase family protein n=1 Tax=Kordiimonas aquimaris TaxID=707591 RepID=UPI0021D29019|nr:glycerophosphodiester phosphodiesterase family protein [Kordiimonas aquimaris]